ncbi:MAG: hypothetical protein ACLFM0_02660 [Spirochaetales bacterium]
MQGLEAQLTRILRESDPRVSNRLLSLPDRTVALAAWSAGSGIAEELIRAVPGAKQARVREELALLERRRFRSRDARVALATVVSALSDGRRRGSAGYLRPTRGRR